MVLGGSPARAMNDRVRTVLGREPGTSARGAGAPRAELPEGIATGVVESAVSDVDEDAAALAAAEAREAPGALTYSLPADVRLSSAPRFSYDVCRRITDRLWKQVRAH